MALVFLDSFLVKPVACIVIGLIYMDDCLSVPFLGKWLIFDAAFALFIICSLGCMRIPGFESKHHTPLADSIFRVLHFTWQLFGIYLIKDEFAAYARGSHSTQSCNSIPLRAAFIGILVNCIPFVIQIFLFILDNLAPTKRFHY